MQSEEWCRKLLQVTSLQMSEFAKSWSVLLPLILCRLWDNANCFSLLYLLSNQFQSHRRWLCTGRTLYNITKVDSVRKCPLASSQVWHSACQEALQSITVTVQQFFWTIWIPVLYMPFAAWTCSFILWLLGERKLDYWMWNTCKMSVKYKRYERSER